MGPGGARRVVGEGGEVGFHLEEQCFRQTEQRWSNMQWERRTNIRNLWKRQERKKVEGNDTVKRDNQMTGPVASGGTC